MFPTALASKASEMYARTCSLSRLMTGRQKVLWLRWKYLIPTVLSSQRASLDPASVWTFAKVTEMVFVLVSLSVLPVLLARWTAYEVCSVVVLATGETSTARLSSSSACYPCRISCIGVHACGACLWKGQPCLLILEHPTHRHGRVLQTHGLCAFSSC